MIKTSTDNELIRFLYGESTQNEELELNQSLNENEDLQEEFFDYSALKEEISSLTVKAPQRVIDKILAYARHTDLESA